MRSTLIILILMSGNLTYAAFRKSTPSTPANFSQVPELFQPNFGFELQIGSQRPINGPDDGQVFKTSFSFLKYIDQWSFGPQISFLRNGNQGEGNVAVESNSTEIMGWGRYSFWRNHNFTTYAGAGVGGRIDTIQTHLMGNSVSATSEMYGLGAIAAGGAFDARAGRVFAFPVRFSLELQYHLIPSYDVQEFSVLLGAGAFF